MIEGITVMAVILTPAVCATRKLSPGIIVKQRDIPLPSELNRDNAKGLFHP